MELSQLMAKPTNNKSVWEQTKSVFNDGTEIISEAFELASETVKMFRKGVNALNLQLDEMIIMQKLQIVSNLIEAGIKEEKAIEIVIAQIWN